MRGGEGYAQATSRKFIPKMNSSKNKIQKVSFALDLALTFNEVQSRVSEGGNLSQLPNVRSRVDIQWEPNGPGRFTRTIHGHPTSPQPPSWKINTSHFSLLMPSHALIQWHWRTSCLTRPGTKAWRMTLANLNEKFLVHAALLVRLNSRLVPPACQTQLCLFCAGAGRGQAGRTACVRLGGAKQGELLV